jgi:hypothetical protein
MKDFVSKITFGFLMAQLLPGTLVVAAATCLLGLGEGESMTCLPQVLNCIERHWFMTTFSTIAFLFAAVAAGMLIHGLNWTVLAWLENWGHPNDPEPVRDRPWHEWPLLRQLLLAPGLMIYEILTLILKAPDINHLTMHENINWIKSECMGQFQFLEDFYLNFGQFFAHMAYALLVTGGASLIFCFRSPSIGSAGLVIALYLTTGVFYILGRVQLGSLFKAEDVLVQRSKGRTSTPANGASREA